MSWFHGDSDLRQVPWREVEGHYSPKLWVILTHTPALPIHNGRNYQELKRKRETHAHNQQRDSDSKKASEKEEEPWRKRMLFQSVAANSRPNSLSVKIESDITRICAGRWDPSQSRGRERKRKSGKGGGGENKRVRGPVSEWGRERTSEQEKRRVKTGRKKERESHHGAQERPTLIKGERQRLKLRRERERGKLRSKGQRQRTQERGRDREYDNFGIVFFNIRVFIQDWLTSARGTRNNEMERHLVHSCQAPQMPCGGVKACESGVWKIESGEDLIVWNLFFF